MLNPEETEVDIDELEIALKKTLVKMEVAQLLINEYIDLFRELFLEMVGLLGEFMVLPLRLIIKAVRALGALAFDLLRISLIMLRDFIADHVEAGRS